MPSSDDVGLTAFPQTEAVLRQTLCRAPIHIASLRRPLQRCDLQQCQGMCCYDGIYLGTDEAAIISDLAKSEADIFHAIGLDLPEQVVVHGSWENLVSGKKTAVGPWSASQLVEGFPGHFRDTACVFHLPDGRCGLQVLSVERGRHPWYFKPTGCWLHPLTTFHEDRHAIGMEDSRSDPCRLPHYPGFIASTHCGRSSDQGQPAYEVLRDELDFLGLIVGRDLYAEITGAVEPGERRPLKMVGRTQG